VQFVDVIEQAMQPGSQLMQAFGTLGFINWPTGQLVEHTVSFPYK